MSEEREFMGIVRKFSVPLVLSFRTAGVWRWGIPIEGLHGWRAPAICRRL